MTIDGKDAERIAKDLIREIASAWIDTPVTRCVEENGSVIFEFTLQPGSVVRYARDVERPVAPSLFRFDPLAEAAEIVISCALMQDQRVENNSTIAMGAIHNCAKPRIYRMLVSAPETFTDAMWQARIIGETLDAVSTMNIFGRPDIMRGNIDSAVAMIEKRLRERFGKIHQKQRPKISQMSLTMTVIAFLPQFKETGQIPSRRQFAKKLGVSPKGWRGYLDRHQVTHEPFLKEWLENLLAIEKKVTSH